MDELTRRILAEEAHRVNHPWDWQILHRCTQCGKEKIVPIHRSEITQFRTKHNLEANEKVTICGICDECSGKEKDNEDNDNDIEE